MERINQIQEVITIKCIACGKRVDPDDIIVMSFNEDDMVCICKEHLKLGYPTIGQLQYNNNP